jgi:hypothetical protein
MWSALSFAVALMIVVMCSPHAEGLQRGGKSKSNVTTKAAPARLPTHLKPSFYDVRLLPHIDPANDDWRIEGEVKIYVTAAMINSSEGGGFKYQWPVNKTCISLTKISGLFATLATCGMI